MARIGGIIYVKVDGVTVAAKGSWTVDPGVSKKEMISGSDGVHGYTEKPKPAKVEGIITDSKELDVEALYRTFDATITIELANGKTFSCEKSVYSGDGEGTTEEGELAVEFQGMNGRYI